MNFKEKMALSKELKEKVNTLKSGKLGFKEKMVASKRVRELVALLRGTTIKSNPEPSSETLEPVVVHTDPNGKEHRVMGLNGNPDLGFIPEGIPGVKAAPIRLQEETFNNGHLQRHLEDLKKAGYKTVEEAVVDIAKNYQQIYLGKEDGQLVLVKPIEIKEEGKTKRGVLLTEFQNVAGVYRVGSVIATSRESYLDNRKLLWDRSLSIAYVDKESTRTRGLTGPEQSSYLDPSINNQFDKDTKELDSVISKKHPLFKSPELADVLTEIYERYNGKNEEILQMLEKAVNVWNKATIEVAEDIYGDLQ